jgi:hypothetical protein
MHVHTSHWCYSVHLLNYAHNNKHTGTHDAIHDIFTTIAWNVDFHVGRKQLYALPSTTFHSARRQVNIVITKIGIHTLIDVVFANWTRMDYFVNPTKPKDLLFPK